MELKKLYELRNAKIKEMDDILAKMTTEERAEMSTEEKTAFDKLESEVRTMEDTISRVEKRRDLTLNVVTEEKKEEIRTAESEERAFRDYICGVVSEQRAGEQNLTTGNNGAIIPTTIANRIIKTVKDICPVLAKATIFSVKGTLKIPKWGLANTSHEIAVGYQTEFVDITADAGKFTSIDLTGYLGGALCLISKSVINNGSFDVVSFVITEMSEKIAAFLEKEILTGSGSSAATGALASANTLTTASGTAIAADELIDLQAKVKQAYQMNACWIMNPATFTAIKKLKDANNRYLLQDDVTGEFPYRLLGKPVYVSDNMPAIALSAKTVLYGDLSGIAVKFSEQVEIQVLNEKYATQHAVGVVGWFEFDSKIMDEQRLAVLVQKVS